MRIALVQMAVQTDNALNMATAAARVREAAERGADIVLLPEMFNCPYGIENFAAYAQPDGGENCGVLSESARENKVYVVGSMPESDKGKVYNTAYAFDRAGRLAAKHRKMHLFDIDVAGGQRFKESDVLSAGDRATVFQTEFGPVGLMICFDIRFPELCRMMALEGAVLVLVPAAFNMTTGPAHWELSFRARALDNQVFMAGCAPARDMDACYHSYGNSIVVSPWGDVVARADERERILYADIDFEQVKAVRKQLPLLSSRRKDVYRLTWKSDPNIQ